MAPAAPLPPASPTPVLIRFGRYTILRLLGMGGMAEVYRATVSGPEGFEKPVVIKRVRSQYAKDAHFVRMFADEAKICASLSHANLVTVFDFGSEEGHYFMAMEYIDGLDLRSAHVRWAQRHGKALPWEVSTLVLRDVLRGLDYAHKLTDPSGRAMGIVHRDIDLANIMVRRDGAVKVLDFGCAKAASFVRRTETVAGTIKGKLGYMSPEQMDERPLDARSDVWAAGVVLHELLTGRRLFYGEDPLAVVQGVRAKPIPDPRSMNPEVPEGVAAITLRALERDLERRYGDAAAMADALESVILEHRIPASRLREVMTELLGITGAEEVTGRAITADERKITLAAWSESTADAEPLEIISGVLLDEGRADTASAPFIDATIITTNPRWHFPGEARSTESAGPSEHPGSEATSAPLGERRTQILMAEAMPVGLHAEATEILQAPPRPNAAPTLSEAPSLALHDGETVLLTQESITGPGPLPSPDPAERPKGSRSSGSPRWPLYVILGGLAVLAGALLFRFLF